MRVEAHEVAAAVPGVAAAAEQVLHFIGAALAGREVDPAGLRIARVEVDDNKNRIEIVVFAVRDQLIVIREVELQAPIGLQRDWSLRFHACDNDQLLCYSKEEGDNLILVCVNLDPRHTQGGWIDFDRAPGASYVLDDLVAASHYTWSGRRNFVQLDPHTLPANVLRVTRK